MEQKQITTKICPFCGETIQAVAIKCRYCGEWLENPAKHLADTAPSAASTPSPATTPQDEKEKVYEGSPSYLSMIGTFTWALLLVILAFFIILAPADKQHGLQTAKITIGLMILLFTFCWILIRMASLKAKFYRLTPERLEFHHGLISRRTDNIDLFRVVDYQMERTLLDQLFKIGTIKIFTSDKLNPELELYKIKCPQRAYDLLKKTTTDADSKSNVVHIE